MVLSFQHDSVPEVSTMKNFMTVAAIFAAFSLFTNNAEAGLFGKKKTCSSCNLGKNTNVKTVVAPAAAAPAKSSPKVYAPNPQAVKSSPKVYAPNPQAVKAPAPATDKKKAAAPNIRD